MLKSSTLYLRPNASVEANVFRQGDGNPPQGSPGVNSQEINRTIGKANNAPWIISLMIFSKLLSTADGLSLVPLASPFCLIILADATIVAPGTQLRLKHSDPPFGPLLTASHCRMRIGILMLFLNSRSSAVISIEPFPSSTTSCRGTGATASVTYGKS